MRQLTNQEKKMTERGIVKVTKELEIMREELAYNKAIVELQNVNRDFEDKWREFKRNRKDEEDRKMLEAMENEVKIKEHSRYEMTKHLEEGVKEKSEGG